MDNVMDARDDLAWKLEKRDFVADKTGVRLVEIVGASFTADEDHLFGYPNQDYISREIAWYESMSLKVGDIPPPVPEIWRRVASPSTGEINSNYGYLLFGQENGRQFARVAGELAANPSSRRAIAIYTRPSMWSEYNRDGMSDFICTNAVQYFIRDDRLEVVVQMRSNDAWAGYRNDYAWQRYAARKLAAELGVSENSIEITWQAGSLHLYEQQFYLAHHFFATGETSIAKAEYARLYPDSEWR